MPPTLQQSAEPDLYRIPVGRELAGDVAGIIGYCENGQGLAGQVQMAPLVVPLVISFGDPFAIGLGCTPESGGQWDHFAAGLFAGPVIIHSSGRCQCIQIDFTPLGARRFFGLPMNELSSRMVRLDDLGDPGILELRQRLGDEPEWSRRLVLARDFVASRLRAAPPRHRPAAAAYDEIVSLHGNLRMAAIAERLDCSRKHLAQCFQTELGLAPKTVARMVRFQRALSLAKSAAEPDWADIAAHCGYADQAHLVREFNAFAGSTPTMWLAQAA